MISKISINNINNYPHFGQKAQTEPSKQAETSRNIDIMQAMETAAKANAAQALAAQSISREDEIKALNEILNSAAQTIKEVESLYEEGSTTREDGSEVKIINTADNKSIMYEYSADVETTRKSTFKDGKLYETRIPVKHGEEVVIRTNIQGSELDPEAVKQLPVHECEKFLNSVTEVSRKGQPVYLELVQGDGIAKFVSRFKDGKIMLQEESYNGEKPTVWFFDKAGNKTKKEEPKPRGGKA